MTYKPVSIELEKVPKFKWNSELWPIYADIQCLLKLNFLDSIYLLSCRVYVNLFLVIVQVLLNLNREIILIFSVNLSEEQSSFVRETLYKAHKKMVLLASTKHSIV